MILKTVLPRLFKIMFVDDISGLLRSKNIETLLKEAGPELDSLVRWYVCNKFAIHPDKSYCMLFGPPYQQNSTLPYINDFLYLPLFLNLNNYGESRIDKVKLIKSVPNESQSTIKVLGVLLDNKLNFSSHITNIHGKVSRSLYSLRQTRNLLGPTSLKLVYAAHVHSHLNYVSFILSAALAKHIEPLASVQRKAIRIVDGAGYRDPSLPIFDKLNIMPLKTLIEYNACIFMYDYNYGHMSE